MSSDKHPAPSRPPPHPPTAGKEPEKVRSDVLFGPRRELIIEHQGREYRLRITQNGKLILTA